MVLRMQPEPRQPLPAGRNLLEPTAEISDTCADSSEARKTGRDVMRLAPECGNDLLDCRLGELRPDAKLGPVVELVVDDDQENRPVTDRNAALTDAAGTSRGPACMIPFRRTPRRHMCLA